MYGDILYIRSFYTWGYTTCKNVWGYTIYKNVWGYTVCYGYLIINE